MKKVMSLLFVTFSCLLLNSCEYKNETNSSLIISEVVEGSGNNRAVELYNISNEEISLDKYSLEIQLLSKIETVVLSGNIKPNETFVIAFDGANDELKSKANLISDSLKFNGTQPILLKKGKKILDIVGVYENQVDYCKDISLVRKKEYLSPRKNFDEYDWIRYSTDNYKYLGTINPSVTNSELLEGPKLTEEYLNAPYYIEQPNGTFLGGGGVMDVKVKSYIDGDTTSFYYDEEILKVIGVQQGVKLRYQNIDTPESYVGNIQEFGLKAKEYTKSRLSSAFEIQIQSVLNGNLTETFDRMLGWVWIDGELLNHSIVKMGYSDVAFDNGNHMYYKDISYSSYLYNAQLYAIKMKKGKHGEKDPYWDYENNRVKDDSYGNMK